jgi:hypothetical protein
MTWLADRLVTARHNWLRIPEWRTGLGEVVDFLADQVRGGEVLLHGSNTKTIVEFEARDQTSYHGHPVRAVFATTDPVWPLFFATTHVGRAGSRWNACIQPQSSRGNRTRYFFSVGAPTEDFWTDGAVYLLPRSAFVPSDEPSEWIAPRPVVPLAVVPVAPSDFPFRDRVFRHVEGEAEWRLETRLLAESTSTLRRCLCR